MLSSNTFVTAAVVNLRFFDAQPGSPEEAYLVQLTAAGTHAVVNHTSSEYGPFNVSIPGAGQMVGGGVGHDTVSGSGQNDVLIGFDGTDTLEFTGISFTDLTITQVSYDVLIEYGASDQLIVENSVIANFSEPEFLFA